jgi:hypothetical protein
MGNRATRLRKVARILLILLVSARIATAQTTTVNGTITDPAGDWQIPFRLNHHA